MWKGASMREQSQREKELKAKIVLLKSERDAFQTQAGARKKECFLLRAELDRLRLEKLACETACKWLRGTI